ncbi:MAG: hypothetical protein ABI441_09910 [Flavobacterium sp.]
MQEAAEIDAGDIWKFIIDAIGIYDAVNDFQKGWNSTGCGFRPGGGSGGSW